MPVDDSCVNYNATDVEIVEPVLLNNVLVR